MLDPLQPPPPSSGEDNLRAILSAGLLGFAAGSVPVGLIVSALAAGIDIRRYGTGNIGASNVRRHVGLAAAGVVGVSSFLQGYLPARSMRFAGGVRPAVAAAAVASVCGYAWSPLLRFRGGSAVGTATGALTAIDPRILPRLLVPYAAGAVARRPARGVLAGLLVACGWMAARPHPWPHRLGTVLITAVVLAKRLEGVSRDRLFVARLLDDRRPNRPLQGRVA
jgi:glycerol-3-phosphate acyltransferase PlsY